jgi:hypothetical protein
MPSFNPLKAGDIDQGKLESESESEVKRLGKGKRSKSRLHGKEG